MRDSKVATRLTAVGLGAISTLAAVAGLGTTVASGAPGDPFTPQPHQWCPGRLGPMGFNNVQWDPTLCHSYYIVAPGQGNVMVLDLLGNPVNVGILADVPPPTLTPPPPHPFCTPPGALIIIPPICDQTGVDIPPGSVGRS